MYLCSLCGCSCDSTVLLLKHFEFNHQCKTGNVYNCMQDNCNRCCSTKRQFMKHLRKKHKLPEVQNNSFIFEDNESINEQDEFEIFEDNIENNIVENNIAENNNVENNIENRNADNLNDNMENMKSSLKSSFGSFIAKLYNIEFLPRNTVQIIYDEFIILFESQMTFLKQCVLPVVAENLNIKEKIDLIFDKLSVESFDDFKSEYKRTKYFKNNDLYVAPNSVLLGEKIKTKKESGIRLYKNVPVTEQYVPIGLVLKKFLESSNNFNLLKSFMSKTESLSPKILTNFCQGSLWKSIKARFPSDRFVVPLFVYYDDFVVGNSYGSHAKDCKLGGVYYTIPAFPIEYLSKLNMIFLAMIFATKEKENVEFQVFFEPLFEELMQLENDGIELTIDNKTEKVYFCLALFLGDNLGVHSVQGFSESFNANYPCRYCKSDWQIMQNMTKEVNALMRTVDNYDADVALNNVSVTGIQRECLFNQLKSFHVAENQAADIMHDIFLGVARYDMALLFNSLLLSTEINLTLNMINSRIVNFDYGLSDGDKPPSISEKHLQNGAVSFYASEMINLIKYLPIALGDLIPEGLSVWRWFLIFRQICDIILSNSVQIEMAVVLESLISEYLSLRKELFPDNTLKPKHHYMVHYPNLLLLIGPLRLVWCMKFEAKHRTLIAYGRICQSKINIPLSIAIKHQLALTYFFINNCKDITDISSSRKIETRLRNLKNIEMFQNVVPNYIDENNIFTLKWTKQNGLHYSIGKIVVIEVDGIFPKFLEICHIVMYDLNESTKTILIGKVLTVSWFRQHLHAYRIEDSGIWSAREIDDLPNYSVAHKVSSAGDGSPHIVIFV